MSSTKIKAFTIAELVIAMMIMSGIAMILFPVLVRDTEKEVLASSLQKTYTSMQQTAQSVGLLAARGKLQIGDPTVTFFDAVDQTMKLAPVLTKDGLGNITDHSEEDTYLGGYKVTLESGTKEVGDGLDGFNVKILKNGVFFILENSGGNDYIVVDVNGKKRPNEVGKDIFYFTATKGVNNAITIEPRNTGNACGNKCASVSDCVDCAHYVINLNKGKINYY